MEHLFEKLKAYCTNEHYPMHMPGHKRNTKLMDCYGIDITEIPGFDNLHHPEDVLLESQKQAAKIYGTLDTFYIVNGSTAGLLAAIHAAAPAGSRVLVGRNAHMSVYNALALRQLRPEYIYPVDNVIRPEDVKAVLDNQTESFRAMIITSPTYEGYISDIKAIADICHENDITLIVDEAHGAHLPFAKKAGEEEFFGKSALYYGADLVVQSLHKTLPAMTQTAVLHRMSDRVEKNSILRALDIYETSSPSYVLMASLEECILYMEENYRELISSHKKNLLKLYEFDRDFCGEILISNPLTSSQKVEGSNTKQNNSNPYNKASFICHDPGKLLINGEKLLMTGSAIYDILNSNYGLISEMYEGDVCLLISSVCDTEEGFYKLKQALEGLVSASNEKKHNSKVLNSAVGKANSEENYIDHTIFEFPKPACMLTPFEAMERNAKAVLWDDLKNQRRIFLAAEPIVIYPPGVPVVTAGEVIDNNILDFIAKAFDMGISVYGVYENLDGSRFVNCIDE